MSELVDPRPALTVLIPFVTIVAILISHRRPNVRESWSLAAAVLTFAIVLSMLPRAVAGDTLVATGPSFLPTASFTLRADPLGMLFGTLASLLWVTTTVYNIGYMRGLNEHAQTRYYAAFAASVGSALGVAFAANLFVLFVCYEVLTVATYPLVAHDESDEARAAGRKYLIYTFGGGVAVLAGSILVYSIAGTVAFEPGGIATLLAADPALARAAFVVLVVGFGVKAALMPLHSWLPDAMVAPTPVSGLLHAVAVVKSGVFGIARVVLDVFGPEGVSALGVGLPLALVAAVTIVTASVIALRKDNLKRRLAYSTVSQLSYIVLGLAILTPASITGGLLHIPAHGFMKLTLFYCAGIIHVETHTDNISEMAGIGKRMPVTMAAFAVAAAGMAGIPLVAGFVSKLFILIGAADSSAWLFVGVLFVSGVLNIAYFWPVVYQAYFETPEPGSHDPKPLLEGPLGGRPHDPGPPGAHDVVRADGGPDPESDELDHAHRWDRRGWFGDESTWFMLGPIVAVAVGSIVLGLVPGEAAFLALIERVVESVMEVSDP